MSYAYDQYLAEHIGNVNKGLHWMLDNLGLSQEEKTAIETAMTEFNHDESKYSAEEYNAYDKYFYGGNRSYKVVQDFSYAWLHHIHQNPHHWQYWVLLEDDPEDREYYAMNFQPGTGEYIMAMQYFPIKTLMIPLPYIFEMIADWWTFSWREGNLFEIFNWYAEHRSRQYMHPESRKIVERVLEKIWDVLIMQETVAGHDISEIEAQYKRFWVEQDVDLLNWDHPSPRVIGKVIDTRETENGLVATVEHSDDHLEHHGILGQKWGVRRYQNKDGTRTEEGKKLEHYRRRTVRELKNVDDVNKIVATLPREEQLALGVGRDDKEWIPKDRRAEISSNIAKTFIEYDGDEPVSMLEIWDIGDGKADIALATNPKYRGTGVTSKNIKAAVNWFNSGNNKEFDQLQWNNLKMNPKSGQIAEHYGFGDYDEDDKWEYRRIFKDKPIEHSDISEDDEDLYGVPELKKFPMPDKRHVKSAIRFFNYVDPKYEKELAEAILEKAEEFGLNLGEDINVGDENRFKKYIPEDILEHTGLKGMKWGIRRFQNYDGSLTEEGKARYGRPSKPVHYGNKNDPRFKQTVFVSGSSKTQNEDSQYYRKELPKAIREELDRYVKDGDTILVGDAPGIDRQVQDYLNSKNYGNVEVYGPGKNVRYSANKKWKTNPIDDPDHEEGSTEWLAKKDEAMAKRASDGIAIILDEGAKATRKNIGRLADLDKNVSVFQLDKNGSDLDRWFDESELLDIMDTEVSKLYQ